MADFNNNTGFNDNVFYISVASLLYAIFSVILKITYIDYESSLDIFNSKLFKILEPLN